MRPVSAHALRRLDSRLICAFAGALFAPATAALKGLDFGLIPTMLWGFMAGMAAYPGVVLPQAAQPEDEPAG